MSPECEDNPFGISALRRDIQRIADEEQRTITQVSEALLHEVIEVYQEGKFQVHTEAGRETAG